MKEFNRVLIFMTVTLYFDGIISSTVFSFPIKIDVAITSEFYILLENWFL